MGRRNLSRSKGKSPFRRESRSRRPLRGLGLVVLFSVVPAIASAQVPLGARIVVLADAEDPRLQQVEASVTFWNETLRDLELPPAFRPLVPTTDFSRRALETHVRQLSQQAGRPGSKHSRPEPLDDVRALDADIVILLSQQDVMPFAWPFAEPKNGSERWLYLVAVPATGARHATEILDIVRHELGHTLGLKHTRGSAGLMCMPCTPAAQGKPRPLSELDRKRLLEIYGASPNQERVQEPGSL